MPCCCVLQYDRTGVLVVEDGGVAALHLSARLFAHSPTFLANLSSRRATRLLEHAGCGSVVKMPLLALLAQQTVMMALSANPRGYCSTPLLSHPLTRHWLHRMWAAFDTVPTIVPHIDDECARCGLPAWLRVKGQGGPLGMVWKGNRTVLALLRGPALLCTRVF